MISNDTFDNKLREKLQNFEADYEERAWRNFSKQLPNDKTQYWFQRSKKAIFYSLATAAAAGLLILGYQNQRLANENKSLVQKNVPALPQEKAQPAPEKVTPPTSDKTKTALQSVTNLAENEAKITPKATEPNALLEKQAQKQPQKQLLKQETADKKVALQVPVVPAQKEKTTTLPKLQDVLTPLTPQTVVTQHQKQEKEVSPTLTQGKQPSLVPSPLIVKQEEAVTPKQEAPLQTPVWKEDETKAAPIVASRLEIVPIRAKEGQLTPQVAIETPWVATPSFSFPNPAKSARHWFSVGTTFILGKQLKANGIALNIAPLPRWSVNVGADFVSFNSVFSPNVNDFRDHHHEDFEDQIPGHFSNETKFTDIRRSRKQWDLPVSVQYNQPIYKGLSLVGNVGTRVFLRSKEQFSYKFKEEDEPEEDGNFEKPFPAPKNVRNRFPLFAGVGVQANVARFQFQAMPFLLVNAPQTQQFPNRKPDSLPIFMQFKVAYTL